MKIEIVENNKEVIAIDDSDGVFRVNQNGSVSYVGPDGSLWYVNNTRESFMSSLSVFELYCRKVSSCDNEVEQMRVVEQLKLSLRSIEDYTINKNAYWNVIVSQADWGHI